MTDYPSSEKGYFHLTPQGWIRRDHKPFPEERIETWSYLMNCPADDAKEQISLTRIWVRPGTTPADRSIYHGRFGEPFIATPERNIMIECDV